MALLERTEPGLAGTQVPAGERIWAARERLIVALDVPSAAGAAAIVDRLEGRCHWFKVGLELFTAAGPAVLEPILKRGLRVFLDLKFHDIPNTVAGAVRSAAALGVHMITVHASGGPAMLAAARTALEGRADPPELLAVTVLTSMDETQLTAAGVVRSPGEQVELMGRLGLASGYRGFVCSPREIARLRAVTGPESILVIPGIRPEGFEASDQRRVATPAEALRAGASFLVVGRPITQAANPAEAVEAIVAEMAGAI